MSIPMEHVLDRLSTAVSLINRNRHKDAGRVLLDLRDEFEQAKADAEAAVPAEAPAEAPAEKPKGRGGRRTPVKKTEPAPEPAPEPATEPDETPASEVDGADEAPEAEAPVDEETADPSK